MMMRKLLVIAAMAACGPKSAPPAIPVLPGDGDAHVAKPAPVKQPAVVDAWTGRGDVIAAPAARPPTAIELPKIDELKLSNGLAVYVVKTDHLPVFALKLVVRAGRLHEPRARLGVSELAADMLVKGTRQHDAAALARAIDFVGGTIGVDSTFEATQVSCSVLARNANTCLELVPEMITQPAFPDSEVTRQRNAMVNTARQRTNDPAALASAHVQNLLWGNEHVRGWINSEQSVAALKREDLVAWHRTWFVPGNAMLVITGDVDARKLRGDLERTFGVWKKGPIPPAPSYQEPGLSGSRIRIVDRPGLSQTHIRIAQLGIKHDDPRFFDALVWNHALGGGTGSRLMKAVRASLGGAYGASSTFDRNADRGSFVAAAFSRNPDAVATAKVMLAEIARMAKDGPTKEEVDAAIVNLTGGYGLRFQAAADLGTALIGAELHGFGQEYLMNYPLAVGHVSVADARQAAAEILDSKGYVLVMVGDAKDLEPELKKEGWRYEKVAFSDPITAPIPEPEVPVDAKASAAAHKVIDEAVAAKGGLAKLTALKAIKLVAAGATTIRGETVPVEIARVYVVPDKMRIDATIKPPQAPRPVVVSVVVTGQTGWQRGPDPKTGEPAVADITGDGFASVDFERWREPELILLKAANPSAKLRPAPDEVIDGKTCAVIKLPSPFGGVDVTLYIDRKTKLIGRMSFSDSGSTETDDFSDYRDVSGVKIAYKRTSVGSGRSTTLQLKSAEVDPTVDPSVFVKPTAAAPPSAPAAAPPSAPAPAPPSAPAPAPAPVKK